MNKYLTHMNSIQWNLIKIKLKIKTLKLDPIQSDNSGAKH